MITGEKIRILRTIKGLSQENMAAMLKITRLAYGKIERGETKINDSRLNEISIILDVLPENILSFEKKVNSIFIGDKNQNKSYEKIEKPPGKKYVLMNLKIENILLKNRKLNIEIQKLSEM